MTPKLAVIAVQTTTPLSLSTVPSNAVANTATARRLNPAKSHGTLRLERTTSSHTRPPATSAANPQRFATLAPRAIAFRRDRGT